MATHIQQTPKHCRIGVDVVMELQCAAFFAYVPHPNQIVLFAFCFCRWR